MIDDDVNRLYEERGRVCADLAARSRDLEISGTGMSLHRPYIADISYAAPDGKRFSIEIKELNQDEESGRSGA
jgi:hypothetical protein